MWTTQWNVSPALWCSSQNDFYCIKRAARTTSVRTVPLVLHRERNGCNDTSVYVIDGWFFSSFSLWMISFSTHHVFCFILPYEVEAGDPEPLMWRSGPPSALTLLHTTLTLHFSTWHNGLAEVRIGAWKHHDVDTRFFCYPQKKWKMAKRIEGEKLTAFKSCETRENMKRLLI